MNGALRKPAIELHLAALGSAKIGKPDAKSTLLPTYPPDLLLSRVIATYQRSCGLPFTQTCTFLLRTLGGKWCRDVPDGWDRIWRLDGRTVGGSVDYEFGSTTSAD